MCFQNHDMQKKKKGRHGFHGSDHTPDDHLLNMFLNLSSSSYHDVLSLWLI